MTNTSTYRLVRIDREFNCMEVEYFTDTEGPILYGIALPEKDEDIDSVIEKENPFKIQVDAEEAGSPMAGIADGLPLTIY